MIDDRPLLQRASEIAQPIVARTADLPDEEVTAHVEALLRPDADPQAVMAHAYGCAMSRLRAVYDGTMQKPALMRCAWCAVAGGDTAESWEQAEYRSPEDASKHALSCVHNPLVVAASEFVLAFDKDPACDGAGAAVRNAFTALRKMISQ